MVLTKILKPIITPFTKEKWQSKNPQVRKKAVQELPVSDQQTLSDIAMNDPDESIRAIAANKLSDLNLLQTIIMKGTNGTVKQAAQQRLFELLSGLKHPIPDYDIREQMVRGSRNSALLEFVAMNAVEAPLRELTIKRLSRDPLLGDIALNDESSTIRQLAAQQIAKRSTLERVAKNSRRKDKRVYKIVKTKLDHIIEDEQRPTLLAKEVVEICDKLEKLYKRNRLLQEQTTFENYVTRWSEIQNFANEELTDRYHAICKQIITSIDQLEQEKQLHKETCEQLDAHLDTLSIAVNELLSLKENSQPQSELIENQEKNLLKLGREWDELIKPLRSKDDIDSYNAKFQAILDLAESQTEPLESNDTENKLKNLTLQVEDMLQKSDFVYEKTISALKNKFEYQLDNISVHSEETSTYQQRFQSAINQLKEKLVIQNEQASQLKSHINTQTQTIQTHINDGHVSKADRAVNELLKDIDKATCFSSSEKQHFQNELKQLQLKLGDLSSWRNWAHGNERENLAQQAEQLAYNAQNSTNMEEEFSDYLDDIKSLRENWKKLRSQTPEDLWNRFNDACNLTYEHCTPYICQQAELRAANQKAKQALCEQLEQYIQAMHWPTEKDANIDHSINWIQVDKITKQARKEWNVIGFVERKQHKPLKERFDNNIEIIRNELKKVWQHNQDKFFVLINKAQALQALVDNDLNKAINQAKELQQEWKTIGPVSSYQRNKLWKKFRKACDVIFDKRQETIDQKKSEDQERLLEKQAICENLEALNEQSLKRTDLEKAFNDIQAFWDELAPQVNSLSKEVNSRFEVAKEAYFNKLSTLLEEEQSQLLSLIKQKAELCTEVETSTGDEDTINQFNEKWQLLESLPTKIETQLKQRFEQALQAINKDKSQLIEDEIIAKKAFCLKNEILLGIDSPESEQQPRMELQVELLNSNMGNKADSKNVNGNTHFDRQLQWYAFSNYSQDAQLAKRFEEINSH